MAPEDTGSIFWSLKHIFPAEQKIVEEDDSLGLLKIPPLNLGYRKIRPIRA